MTYLPDNQDPRKRGGSHELKFYIFDPLNGFFASVTKSTVKGLAGQFFHSPIRTTFIQFNYCAKLSFSCSYFNFKIVLKILYSVDRTLNSLLNTYSICTHSICWNWFENKIQNKTFHQLNYYGFLSNLLLALILSTWNRIAHNNYNPSADDIYYLLWLALRK